MSKIKIVLVLLLCTHQLYTSGQISFSEEGKLTSLPPKKVKTSGAVTLVNQFPKNALSNKEKQFILEEFCKNLKQTLYNLNDVDSLDLKNAYENIWGPRVYEDVKSEITQAIIYLNDPTKPKPVPVYFLPVDEISTLLTSDKITEAVKTVSPDGDSVVINVQYTDVLKRYLYNKYNSSVSAFSQEMDFDYVNNWRKVEAKYHQILQWIDTLNSEKNLTTSCNAEVIEKVNKFIQAENADHSYKEVQKLLQNNFFKQWLWMSGGMPYINPIAATTTDRLFPVEENISYMTPEIRKKIDSTQNSKILNEFKSITSEKNRVILPIVEENDVSFFKQPKEVFLLNLDYSKNYKGNRKELPVNFTDKQKIIILVHNIPSAVTVRAVWADSVIQNRSQTDLQITQGFSSLGSYITALNPLAAIFTSTIATLLNKQTLLPPASGIAIPSIPKDIKTSTTQVTISKTFPPIKNFSGVVLDTFSTLMSQGVQTSSVATLSETHESEKVNSIFLDNQEISLTHDIEADKRSILLAYLKKNIDNKKCLEACNKREKTLIEAFLNSADCYRLNYDSEERLIEEAKNLIKKFKCFLEGLKTCQTELKELLLKLGELRQSYRPYISIISRSLPPKDFHAIPTLTQMPDYRTYVEPKIAEISRDKEAVNSTLTLMEGKSTAKEGDAEKPTFKSGFKFGKLKFVALSTGLAFTTSSYNMTTLDKNSGLPVSMRGDRFKLLAGINIYPYGIFNLDERIGGTFKNRASLFLGVGIPKPLENYYIGFSYDIVPGVKVITGCHLFKQTKFSVLNNQVVDKISAPKAAGLFLSANFSLEAVTGLINIFKKN